MLKKNEEQETRNNQRKHGREKIGGQLHGEGNITFRGAVLRIQTLLIPILILLFTFDTDPDHVFQFYTDPDPYRLIRIRILTVSKM
jgi:hypothetical protein